MAVALKGLALQTPGRIVTRTVQATLSGNYVTGGDTMDLTAITTNGIDGMKAFSRIPIGVYPLNDVAGFYFEVIAGATLATYKLKLWTPGGTEAAAAAYSTNSGLVAGLLANPLLIEILSVLGK